MLTEPEKLRKVSEIIEDSRTELLFSAASSWEISIKFALGRLPLPEPPAVYVPNRIRSSGVTPLAIEHSHALAVADLPDHHRDPFDRLLITQARIEEVPLITADSKLESYDVALVRVR